MKNLFLFIIACAMAVSCGKNTPDWKTGVQTFTFHKFTFMETLDKIASLGLQYAEVYYGQPLGSDFGDQKMDFRMDESVRKKLLEAARAKNVQIIASGVVTCNDAAEWEQLFAFADGMGISLITCEPNPEHLDLVEQLAERYQIDVSIHNHPKPSSYWSPDSLMKALEGRSTRMGVCADVGHWKREGIDPVKALQQTGSRLKSLHFKDIKAPEPGDEEQHDVIWGKGVCDVPGMLDYLESIKFNGLMSIEYEYNWDNSLPDIRQCIEMMNNGK